MNHTKQKSNLKTQKKQQQPPKTKPPKTPSPSIYLGSATFTYQNQKLTELHLIVKPEQNTRHLPGFLFSHKY